MEDGTEQPIVFVSRTLSPAEKKYAQIEKEGLAIIFGVKRFHQFLYGRRFHIHSDHRPLEHLFSDLRPVPALASARIQRWVQLLGAYDYTISYKAGEQHANADSLSRLPLSDVPDKTSIPGETILLLQTLNESPVTPTQIKTWTANDPVLSQVKLKVLAKGDERGLTTQHSRRLSLVGKQSNHPQERSQQSTGTPARRSSRSVPNESTG